MRGDIDQLRDTERGRVRSGAVKLQVLQAPDADMSYIAREEEEKKNYTYLSLLMKQRMLEQSLVTLQKMQT